MSHRVYSVSLWIDIRGPDGHSVFRHWVLSWLSRSWGQGVGLPTPAMVSSWSGGLCQSRDCCIRGTERQSWIPGSLRVARTGITAPW